MVAQAALPRVGGQVAFDATTNFLVCTSLGASLLHVLAGFAVMGPVEPGLVQVFPGVMLLSCVKR